MTSMFRSYCNRAEIRYVDVLRENALQKPAIYKSMDIIFELYDSERNNDGGITILA